MGVGIGCGDDDKEMQRPALVGPLDMERLTNNVGYRD